MLRNLSLAAALVSCAAWVDAAQQNSKVDLSKRYRPPAWLSRVRVNVQPRKLTEKKWGGLALLNEMENVSLGMLMDQRRFRQNIATIHLVERANAGQPWHVHTLMTLGLYYEAFFGDLPSAHHFFKLAQGEADGHSMRDAQTHGPRPLRGWALVARARVIAKAGDREGSIRLLGSATFSDWRDTIDASRVYQILGDTKRSTAAAVAASANSGGNRFRQALCLGRCVLIFCENGEKDLARRTFDRLDTLLEGMPRKERQQADVASTHRAASEALQALKSAVRIDLSKLRSGTVKGQAYAYSGPLTVSVRVSKSKIVTVNVTSHKEKRPFNALSAVPERIVAKQELRVDAVTGATVTSRAIERAVDDALAKAQRR